MNNNTWIKRSEREPQPDEFPVLAGYYLGGHDKWNEYRCGVGQQLGSATHWHSIKCDPPPRELTQRERDERFAATIVNESLAFDRVGAVLMGMHRERREVAKLLASYFCSADWGLATNSPALNSLRARLDEQGGGK